MANKTPLKAIYSGGSVSSLAEFVSGDTVPITSGGTGQTTASTALNALLPSQTGNGGMSLVTDGSNASWAASGSDSITDAIYWMNVQ